ncbi:RNA polymerase sigma factor [Sulfitobacter sabulilitoris]|uniref:Sigma-70 family RNA polymerase sigma factor n=1 Tax=Sulfitobacter sabulilitoris TaxID=2562655 RepID=A0A5S3PKA2_9RHOB|nr:sigma-70 family RNA polymerase sigma factor [Sulfitobacter sabulilitoris]TMM54858.1 sigma-70 family RNA polymerase sigma factor [Sulfitobacter sabulilitoris]
MHLCPDIPDPLLRLIPRIRARAARLTSSSADADDLAQDALIKLWQITRRGQRIEALDRYAMTVLHNLARQRWRQARQMEELGEDDATCAPDAPVRMACADLAAAIDRLPRDQARLMHCVAAGETSPAALARATGVPPGTVMSRLSRARTALRADLGLGRGAPVSDLF